MSQPTKETIYLSEFGVCDHCGRKKRIRVEVIETYFPPGHSGETDDLHHEIIKSLCKECQSK